MIAPARATASPNGQSASLPGGVAALRLPYAATARTGLAMAVADRPRLALRAAACEKKDLVTPEQT